MEDSSASASVSLSLRSLAVAAVLVALTSVATLIVVVSVQGIDALSTLALALAVLAFVVQLIVFIVQAADASRQTARNQRLHAQMMAVLAQIQERTQGTQQSVDRMNSKLLEAVIGKATGEGLAAGTPEFADRVVSGISVSNGTINIEGSQESAASAGMTSWGVASDYPNPLPSEEASAIQREMTTWPKPDRLSEIEHLAGVMEDGDWDDLYRLAADLARTTTPRAPFGPGLALRFNRLQEHGLAEKIPGWRLFTLTEKGRLIGRLMTAKGEAPKEYARFVEIRRRVEKDREAMERRLLNREPEDPAAA